MEKIHDYVTNTVCGTSYNTHLTGFLYFTAQVSANFYQLTICANANVFEV